MEMGSSCWSESDEGMDPLAIESTVNDMTVSDMTVNDMRWGSDR